MTVVIRPAPGVFRRSMPLVVAFGLFRRYDQHPPLDETDIDGMRRIVGLARRYHIPLAYSRIIDDAKNPSPGYWLPGCRPKVTDRLFEHGPGSIFQNREFSNVFGGITDRKIYFTGPRVDSSLWSSASDILCNLRSVEMISTDPTLQNCSTSAQDSRREDGAGIATADVSRISVADWEYSMRCVEVV